MENFKSIRDCLEEGLKAANRKTFLYRVIYIGQHDFKSIADLKKYFQRNVDHCNDGFCYEKLTGFLLCYPKLLIHLIEGSEDVIHSHFELLCVKQQTDELHDLRIVITWPHLIARAANSWFAKSGQPKKSGIEVYSTCQASPFVRLCINSMCMLAEVLSEEQTSKTFQEGRDNDSQSEDSVPVELIPKLPDPDQIEFLTKCTVLERLEQVYDSMYKITRTPYEEVVWPAPSVYIPYDVIKTEDQN